MPLTGRSALHSVRTPPCLLAERFSSAFRHTGVKWHSVLFLSSREMFSTKDAKPTTASTQSRKKFRLFFGTIICPHWVAFNFLLRALLAVFSRVGCQIVVEEKILSQLLYERWKLNKFPEHPMTNASDDARNIFPIARALQQLAREICLAGWWWWWVSVNISRSFMGSASNPTYRPSSSTLLHFNNSTRALLWQFTPAFGSGVHQTFIASRPEKASRPWVMRCD